MKEIVNKRFGEQLKHIRQKLGLSQVKLSELTGIPASSISKFEAGERMPSLYSFISLQEELGVSADELLQTDYCLVEGE